jgi:hypothetical protein
MSALAMPAFDAIEATETLEQVLSPTHDLWIEEARQLLLPDAAGEPVSWDRWSAIRYLNERLVERLRSERAMVQELRPFLTTREAITLEAGGERAGRLALALDRLARRRGTTVAFGAIATEFLEALSVWCAEIELAARHVRFSKLPGDMQRKLEQLDLGAGTTFGI